MAIGGSQHLLVKFNTLPREWVLTPPSGHGKQARKQFWDGKKGAWSGNAHLSFGNGSLSRCNGAAPSDEGVSLNQSDESLELQRRLTTLAISVDAHGTPTAVVLSTGTTVLISNADLYKRVLQDVARSDWQDPAASPAAPGADDGTGANGAELEDETLPEAEDIQVLSETAGLQLADMWPCLAMRGLALSSQGAAMS